MEVYKSNKTLEEFSEEKLKNGIREAYDTVGEKYHEEVVNSVISNLYVYDKISSKEIRRQVEESLMSINKKVARVYMDKYHDITELTKKNTFIKDYINASNASTGSKYDSNANVSNKNIVTMGQELYKINNIKQNRYIMQNKIKALYGKKLSLKYIEDLELHRLYKHDETALPGYPYCVAITMYPFLVDGLCKLGGVSKPPTNLKSFCGEFVNMVFSISSQFAGAVATPEYLMYMDYFIRHDYGDDYINKVNDVVELTQKGATLEKVIENCFQQVVHSINMPTGSRGYQAVFWNVSYFDKSYFEGVFGDFTFPDGSKPVWETLSWLQKKFMKWFNEERTKYELTFPVETMALLTDDKDILDKEYGDFTCEMLSEGHSFFIYLSDSPDSLASCCFGKDQKTLTRSPKDGVNFMTFEELYKTKADKSNNFKILHNGSWVQGKLNRLEKRNMYKIITSNNKEIIVSDNHINPTYEGEKQTKDLTINDYLLFNTNRLDTFPEKDEKLTYEMGFAVGAFLGDGSFDKDYNGIPENIFYSLNEKKYEKITNNVNKAVQQLGEIDKQCVLHNIYNNVYPVAINSKKLFYFIQKWTKWERGTYSFNKQINMDCLEQSFEFRKGILEGWYATDGGNSNRCYTASKELAEDMEAIIMSLGLNSIIDISNRTDEKVVIREQEFDRNYPLYCVRWYNAMNKRSMKDVFILKNNSMYFKIKSIEKIDYDDDNIYCFEMKNENEPYFTLPNGLITHNCRLRNSLKDINDETHNHTTHQFSMGTASVATGSKSVMTINLNRVIQDAVKKYCKDNTPSIDFEMGKQYILNSSNKEKIFAYISQEINDMTTRVHKYQKAFNEIEKDFLEAKMLPVYDAGFISMKKQYLTIGVNGLTDAAEFLGLDIKPCDEYNEFVNVILETINKSNAKDRTKEAMFNTEFVPGENLSVKNYNWDKKDNYYVSPKHMMYSSYFFNPEDESLSVIDKIKLHGKEYVKYLDGGSANHMNIKEHLSFDQYKQLLKIAAKEGCNYLTWNCKNTICNDCGYISKHTLDTCPHCGSKNLDYLTRIIGYLKRVSSFSEPRQNEEHMRYYEND